MANILSNVNIISGETVRAKHVSQSIDAFTGAKAYNISLSGSFNMTGPINGQPTLVNPLTASYAMTASIALNAINSSTFPFNGNAEITGSLNVLGSSTFEGPVGGLNNTAIGTNALVSNSTGTDNIAIGTNALASNSTGANNIAIGTNAMDTNSTAINNIVIGINNRSTRNHNIIIGTNNTASSHSGSILIGRGITSQADGQLHIGSAAFPIGTTAGNQYPVVINGTLVFFKIS